MSPIRSATAPRDSGDFLELALALRRAAEETVNQRAAIELARLAVAYLQQAEMAQIAENAGKPVLGR
jgi:hypothetical protein